VVAGIEATGTEEAGKCNTWCNKLTTSLTTCFHCRGRNKDTFYIFSYLHCILKTIHNMNIPY